VLLGLVALALILGLGARLRDATLSTHTAVAAESRIELLLNAEMRGAEQSQNLAELVQAQVLVCRLEVASDIVGAVEEVAAGRYRAVLSPSMDASNRRQFRGCLEDWGTDHVRLAVLRLAPT
jgi:hypothetical protein